MSNGVDFRKIALDLRGQLDAALGKLAAQHQGEPVGYVSPAGLEGAKSGKTAMFRSCVVGVYTIPLYAEQPAPVVVVMPERYSLAMFQMISGFESVTPEQFELVWTACRKEVSRLNGVKS